jgi:hypothetical protein
MERSKDGHWLTAVGFGNYLLLRWCDAEGQGRDSRQRSG